MRNKPILILHGLGDNLLLFPVFYDYFLQHNNEKLVLIVASNYGAKNFWDNITFVDKVYEISLLRHPRFWNLLLFLISDYKSNLLKAKQVSKKNDIHFLKISLLPLFIENFLSRFIDRHKIILAYKELHVKPLTNKKKIKLESFFIRRDDSNVLKFLKKYSLQKNNYICIHRLTYAKSKSIKKEQINKLIKQFPQIKFVIIMTLEMKEKEKKESGNISSQNVTYATDFTVIDLYYLLKYAQKSIVIDSSIMHLSQFVSIPTLALFKVKKIHPELILPYTANIISKRVYTEKDEYEAMEKFII